MAVSMYIYKTSSCFFEWEREEMEAQVEVTGDIKDHTRQSVLEWTK